MRDTILGKLREIEELLASATCDGMAIAAGTTCDSVHSELTSALRDLEDKVDYYVD
jgi:hypothetical protein